MNFKRIILLAITMVYCLSSYAQFKLSGKILNYDGKEELNINIPLVFGFHKENSLSIPIAKDGSFTIILPIRTTKFANLIYKRTFHTLVLNPSKNLIVNLKDTTLNLIAGTALSESKVMQLVNLEEYPFFLANDGNNKYANLSLLQLKAQVLSPYFKQRDDKIKLVNASTISTQNKLLIATELRSITYNYLNDLARTQTADRTVVDSLILEVFENSNPTPDILPAGPQFYGFVDNYIRFLESKAFNLIRKQNIKPTEPVPYYGITLDSANLAYEKYGKPYLRWICVSKNLSSAIAEQYLYQEIINQFYDKDIRQITPLINVFNASFPKSFYRLEINSKFNSLNKMLALNQLNKNIKVIEGFENMTSIYEVLKPYKGKVVYLDIWGTWCGPCKEELQYIPELRSKFKNKDVVFVYLDMDDESKDASWREFITTNGIIGTHLRKNRQTIAPIWKELLANAEDKAEYYPQYFIFDKDGKLAVAKANRPSSKEELYTQLENYLK